MSYELFVGMRYLKSKKKLFVSVITLICIVGVMLGVAILTSAVSITGGFQEEFRKKVLGINSHILVMKYGINFREYRDTMAVVEEVPGVQASSPFIFHEMMIHHDKRTSWVLIKGIDPDRVGQVSDLPMYLRQGTLADLRWHNQDPHHPDSPLFLPDTLDDAKRQTPPPSPADAGAPSPSPADAGTPSPADAGAPSPADAGAPSPADAPKAEPPPPGIFLGTELAARLKVEVGDTVTLVSPLRGLSPDAWAPTQMAPSNQSFKVVGVYRSGFYEYDNKLVMVDYRALQDFFHQGDVVTGLEIRVDDVFGTGDISQEIKHRLPPGRFRTLDWREINRNLFASLKLQEIALSIILIFIIVVASFNIVCTLIMLVLEKSKDIAILKSMGASNGGVMRVFIVQGMTIGTIGTALGLLVGFLTCWGLGSVDFGLDAKVYLIDRLPVKMQLWQFGAVALVSLLISFTATLYPSWYAARLPPVEGLRYD